MGARIPRIGDQGIDAPLFNAAYDFQTGHEFSFVGELASPGDGGAHGVRPFVLAPGRVMPADE